MSHPGSAAVPAARKAIHTAGETPALPGGLPGNAAVPAARNDIHAAGGTPALPGWRNRDYLPHFDGGAIPQFITYHLADSLPRQTLERMERELAELPNEERKALKRERLNGYLDAGIGCCVLRDPVCARIVQGAFLHGDGERYRLLGWCVMPNHVHVLIEPRDGRTLDRIEHSWKSFTAHAILKTAAGTAALPGCGHVWHREYWDRYIRDERHYAESIRYMELNPVRASLCREASAWPWSHVGRDFRATSEPVVP